MKCSRRHPRVQLGNGWRFFAMVRPGLVMLGTIQSGLEIGALALAGEGNYVQVNGSIVQKLHAWRVEPAIERCRQARLGPLVSPRQIASGVAPQVRRPLMMPMPDAKPVEHSTPTTPTVVYKKRRHAMAVCPAPG